MESYLDKLHVETSNRIVEVSWELTSACNARCIHCCSSTQPFPKKNELPTEQCKTIIEELSGIPVFFLRFSGGEPFLRRDIFELLEFSSKRGLLVSVATNGLLIRPHIVKKLKSLGLHYIMISLDGSSPRIHDTFRQVPGLFYRAIKAIRMSVKKGLRVKLGFTATRVNYQEADKIINIALKYGVSSVIMSEFVPIGRGSKNLDLSPMEWKRLVEYWMKKRIELKDRINLELHDVRMNILVGSSRTYSGCMAGKLFCHITSDGNVTPCPMLRLELGNLKKQSLCEILKSSILKDLRDGRKLRGRCRTCNFRKICGGCRALAYAYTGNYHSEDNRCWIVGV